MCLANPFDHRLLDARLTEQGLRQAAALCGPGQEGIRARLIQAADQISTLVGMVDGTAFVERVKVNISDGTRA